MAPPLLGVLDGDADRVGLSGGHVRELDDDLLGRVEEEVRGAEEPALRPDRLDITCGDISPLRTFRSAVRMSRMQEGRQFFQSRNSAR